MEKVLIGLTTLFILTRQDLEQLKPEVDKFTSAFETRAAIGVIITVKGSKDNGCVDGQGVPYDFVSRYFAPWAGIPEDPVTGIC